MKNSLRKRNIKTHRRHKANNRRTRRRSGGFINSSHITNAYNTATQAYQSLNEAYSGLQQKYQESMQQYQDMKQKYDDMKEKLTEISNDPAVQKHLDTLSTLHSQLTNTMTPEEKMTGGFFNTSSLNNAYQSVNTSLTNKKQQLNAKQQQFNTVYKHPEVQKNLKDLSTHSYNTAKHGSLLGVNVATGAPFSAAYRGYNTYSSAKKGIKSAKNLYSSANDAYKSSGPQASI
jgi:septation ring formation regulator EzrA